MVYHQHSIDNASAAVDDTQAACTTRLTVMPVSFHRPLFFLCLLHFMAFFLWLLAAPVAEAAIIEISQQDLVITAPHVVRDESAVTNTRVMQQALDACRDGDVVLLPAGSFLVKNLLITGKRNIKLRGAGAGKTLLRRHAERWDNDTQGPFRGLAILHVKEVDNFELSGITFDGNAEHMEIKGPGTFDRNRFISSGSPQFPTCEPDGSHLHTVAIERSHDMQIHHAEFQDGYRWCVYFGQVKKVHFHHNQITTGRLSTTWMGHTDQAGGIMHCHQSQDGLHLVNVVNAIIQWNTIRSEDSAISIEANPAWNWYALHGETMRNLGSRQIRVLNNDISTNSAAHEKNLVTGHDLAQQWIGQGCIDVFYHEKWDKEGKVDCRGERALIRDILIAENRLSQARHAVRVGIFRNANENNATSPQHRIQGLTIINHHSRARAGHDHQAIAGVSKITKDVHHPHLASRHGGVAFLLHHADAVVVEDNEITDVDGGSGIEMVGCTKFFIRRNRISHIRGTKLAEADEWHGGEGIRIGNPDTKPCFDAHGFVIADNLIRETASYGIFITDTANGQCSRKTNITLQFFPWSKEESRGIYLRNVERMHE
jgi:hypothetical protein